MINRPSQPWPTGTYRLLEPSFIAPCPGQRDVLQEAGAVITYQGRPGGHMQPMDEPAKTATARAEAEQAALAALWG